MPNIVVPASPPRRLRDLLREQWGNNFESYVILPGGKNDIVRGTLWELTKNERDLVKNWEQIDYLYKEIKVKVTVENGQIFDALTESLGNNQKFDREIDGLNYQPFLRKIKDYIKISQEARLKYFERKNRARKK